MQNFGMVGSCLTCALFCSLLPRKSSKNWSRHAAIIADVRALYYVIHGGRMWSFFLAKFTANWCKWLGVQHNNIPHHDGGFERINVYILLQNYCYIFSCIASSFSIHILIIYNVAFFVFTYRDIHSGRFTTKLTLPQNWRWSDAWRGFDAGLRFDRFF